MFGHWIKIDELRGVGNVILDFSQGQKIHTFIGPNGIGKTKILEALFQASFLALAGEDEGVSLSDLCFKKISTPFGEFLSIQTGLPRGALLEFEFPQTKNIGNTPVLFLASLRRGEIFHSSSSTEETGKIGRVKDRRKNYFRYLLEKVNANFSSMNMDTDIEDWFVTLAQSANPYQKQEDNREIEIKTVLKLLHEIDAQIDPQFLEIAGDGRVSLKINGQKRELSHLSTGFASILKMIQAIVSGYGYFTNEVQLQNVRGIVLIDEIESHLHLSWQSGIIPLLKKLFPNTTFYITTHSPIVLTQLNEGEAYRLERDADGVVRTHLIHAPNRAAMVDVLQEAFGVDLNRIKQDSASPESQKAAKQQLLNLLKAQWGEA